MRIPQLFIKIGKDRYYPVARPVKNKPLYFWNDLERRIVPAENVLKTKIIEGRLYFVF